MLKLLEYKKKEKIVELNKVHKLEERKNETRQFFARRFGFGFGRFCPTNNHPLVKKFLRRRALHRLYGYGYNQ